MAEPAGTDPAPSFTAHETGIDKAIQAFETCDPPDNRALADFIERHAARLTASQRQAIQRLVTWPVRGPERMGAELGMTALLHLSESEGIAAMWSRWIRRGAFDGQPCAPVELARFLVEARREQVTGRERLDEALRTHVRAALRSGEVGRIHIALTQSRSAPAPARRSPSRWSARHTRRRDRRSGRRGPTVSPKRRHGRAPRSRASRTRPRDASRRRPAAPADGRR